MRPFTWKNFLTGLLWTPIVVVILTVGCLVLAPLGLFYFINDVGYHFNNKSPYDKTREYEAF